MAKEILIDVNRCTGCWTCSTACKLAHDLPVDEYWLFIRTIGAGGIDEAGGTWPNLYLKWNPVFTQQCIKCVGDESTGGVPYCAYNCPTEAMLYGDVDDPNTEIAKHRETLLDNLYHEWKFPQWEKTRDDVTYMERGI